MTMGIKSTECLGLKPVIISKELRPAVY